MTNPSIYDTVSLNRQKIMGFAAILILINHCWKYIFLSVPLLCEIEYFFRNITFFGVDIFFFLSGIGLMVSYSKAKSLLSFYKRRLQRIILPFLVGNFLCQIQKGDYSILEFLLRTINLNLFADSNYYPYYWFIPAIIVLYLLFPLIYKLFMTSKHKYLLIVVSILVLSITAVCLNNTFYPVAYRFLYRIPIFLLGMLFCYEGMTKKTCYSKKNLSLFGVLLAIGLYLMYLMKFKGFMKLTLYFVELVPCILVAISTTVLLAYFLNKFNNNFINNILNFFGTFTLELYVIQVPFEGFIQEKIAAIFSPLLTNIIFFLIVIVVAYLLSIANTKINHKIP